ncbi:MAG: hypothetical protein KAR06_04270 [Deltaproteobacteria bacterium]|nr:hypothetical protein [Deltaproteobacteria bacterium]
MHYLDIAVKWLMVGTGLWLAIELCVGMVNHIERRTERPMNSKKRGE